MLIYLCFRSRWRSQTEEDHRYHENNVVFRGILDVIMETGDFLWIRVTSIGKGLTVSMVRDLFIDMEVFKNAC